MSPFKYTELNKQAAEIRLVDLLPGSFDDPIRLQIRHSSLPLSKEKPRGKGLRTSAVELERTLPPDWVCRKNLEGRIFFGDRETGEISWQHPDSKFDEPRLREEDPEGQELDNVVERYEALSYVWGDVGSPVHVHIKDSERGVNGDDDESTLDIGPNLACALRYLRLHGCCRTLWIDAICINQANVRERSEQVIRMHGIYRCADRVVVWLGPDSPSSGLALSTLAYLGSQSEYTQDYGMWRAPQCEEPDWWDPGCALPYDQETWDSILALLSRPWFERVWVIQEIQSSANAIAYCGKYTILWRVLRRAILTLEPKTGGLSAELQSRLGSIKHLARHYPETKTFTLLCNSDRGFCSDPRDKIYGILSMTSQSFGRKVKPDYSRSCGDTYMDAILAHINITNLLELLSLCGQCGRDPTWPTWIPDYMQRRRYGEIFETYFAAGYSSAQARYNYPGTLEVTGVLIDTVIGCSREIPPNSQDVWSLIRAWCKAESRPVIDLTSPKYAKAFLSAIRMGRFRDHYPNIYSYPFVQDLFNLLQKFLSLDGPICQQDAQKLGLRYITGGKLLSTSQGMLCNGPSNAQAGRLLWE